jgi:hypothetical protein
MGFLSTIVLDQNFAIGRAFGSMSTPSAALIDAEGKIASGLQVGSAEVLKLAGATHQSQPITSP